jgi:tRNA A-37 threonylcarbamoyl transferase component Bud32
MEQGQIQIPSSGGQTTTGRSFDREMEGILWQRTRLVFLIGIGASVFVFILNLLYGLEPVAFAGWNRWLHLAHPLSFILGLAAVHVGERSLAKIQGVAFWVVAFNLLLVISVVAIFYPFRESFLPVAVMLFVMAAFLPCRNAQIWLAGFAVVVAIVSYTLLSAIVPEVAAYWEELGSRAAFWEKTWRVSGITMIGVISALVSRNLHSLHRSAHRAKRLGNYLIEKELGEGGMGQVFVARHAMICRPTAVKVMSGDQTDGPAAVARFEREVRLSASLTHPNTITIFDFGRTSDNTFYYAMEYLEGLDLHRLVDRFGPLPADRVVYLLSQICGSLAEAHARGIVHRDIKPSNIFITHRGGLYDFVKVLDFGLAREVKQASDSGLTKSGMVFGTPRYIAPESVYGANRADSRSDLYNLGGVAYWMLTGTHLFGGSSSLDLIIDHVKTIPQHPNEVSELPIPDELDALVMKCLEKEPVDRFQTAEAVKEALLAVPLSGHWSQVRARDWWALHAPEMFDAVAVDYDPTEGGRRPSPAEAVAVAD